MVSNYKNMNNLTNTEQKIIEAGKIVFLEKGFETARMKDIADEADISRTSLNYYYRTKEKLFNIVLEQLVSVFATRLLKILGNKEPLENKIDHFIDEYTELIIEFPRYPHFLINEITQRPQQFIELINNIISKFDFFEKLQNEILFSLDKEKRETINSPQIFMSALSVIIIPSLAWPVYSNLTNETDEFDVFLRNHKKQVKNIIKSQIIF